MRRVADITCGMYRVETSVVGSLDFARDDRTNYRATACYRAAGSLRFGRDDS